MIRGVKQQEKLVYAAQACYRDNGKQDVHARFRTQIKRTYSRQACLIETFASVGASGLPPAAVDEG